MIMKSKVNSNCYKLPMMVTVNGISVSLGQLILKKSSISSWKELLKNKKWLNMFLVLEIWDMFVFSPPNSKLIILVPVIWSRKKSSFSPSENRKLKLKQQMFWFPYFKWKEIVFKQFSKTNLFEQVFFFKKKKKFMVFKNRKLTIPKFIKDWWNKKPEQFIQLSY